MIVAKEGFYLIIKDKDKSKKMHHSFIIIYRKRNSNVNFTFYWEQDYGALIVSILHA